MKLLTEKQVSEVTGIAEQTLRNHRCRGIGLPFVRVGSRSIRYEADVVMDAVRNCLVKTILVGIGDGRKTTLK